MPKRKRNPITNEQIEMLEAMVDRLSVHEVIDALETVCYLKAQHLEEAWQDRYTARVWERGGKLLGKLALAVKKIGL
jgi:hypothetical protein